CGQSVPGGTDEHCAGFGTISHAELDALAIAHVDCDAFFASIEKRDRPELKHRPVAVGGGDRGVVAAACYIARSYGVRSAMPSFQARKLCPELVFVRSNFEAYREASAAIRQAMNELTPLVQPVSIDEAYLDLSGTHRLHRAPPSELLIKLQRQIEREVGVTVSVGLSHNKALAKMASERDKPRGFAVIGKEETLRLLAAEPVSAIHGVGGRFAKKLEAQGLRTIGDLQKLGLRALVDRFGDTGLWLHGRAIGHDPRPVVTSRETKSISGETTFSENLSDRLALEDKLYAMAKKVSARAREKGLAGLVITLKLKTSTFRSLTRRRTLGVAVNLTTVLFEEGKRLLAEELAAHPRTAYRLIGIGISDLVSDEEARRDLAYPEQYVKVRQREDALSDLRSRFGDGVIGTMRDKRTTRS
ncbi:MAG: DNA polymerase IV, partial [Parvularcula sp.]|nr:DNA polymerase IV [Parvularcula sp.]